MKILVVGQHFYPESFRINSIVEELAKSGHEVTVLTGYPNYPDGEFFQGYSPKLPYNTDYNGAKIVRVKLHPRKTGKFNLIKNYLSFWRNANKWVKKNAKGFDITYSCQTSPVFMSLPCITAKKKFGIPCIINVQDMWPESFECVTGIHNKIVIGVLKKISNKVYKNADKLLCSSKSFIDILANRGVKKENLEYWPQYSECYNVDNLECPQEYKTKYRFVFTGNIGEAQGLNVVLDAAMLLKDRPDIGFYLIGDGSERKRLEKIVKDNELNNIIFINRQPEQEIPKYLTHATAALLTLKENILSKTTVPAKMQMYMACGCPIICTFQGEAGDIIKHADCGEVCDENSGKALFNSIKAFVSLSEMNIINIKQNAIKYNQEYFNKNNLMSELNSLIKCLAYNNDLA